jgi:hypothetical protein
MEAFFASVADLLAGLVQSHDQKRSQLQKEGTQLFSFHQKTNGKPVLSGMGCMTMDYGSMALK